MADILDLANCDAITGTFNSGVPFCDVLKDIPLGIIGLDPGVGFSPAERASKAAFMTALNTKIRADRGSRAYPLMKLSNYEDKSKEPTKAALGNLVNGEGTILDGIPAFDFQHRIGEIFHRQLLGFQTAGLTWLIVDKKYVVYGTIDGETFTGYSLSEFYVGLSKFGTTSGFSTYPFSLTLASQTEYKENGRFVQLDSSIAAVTGIREVVLALVSQATNVANISATALGGKNLGELYPTQLAAVGAWVATNTQTGAAVTITSVTYNSTLKTYVITVDSTAYAALTSGQKITINLDSTADLTVLGVDGFESTGGVDIVHA